LRKKGERKRVSGDTIFKIISVVILLSMIGYVAYFNYEKIVKRRILEEKCNEIERSPDLLFDCDCFPTPESKKNTADYVENRTEAFCTCVCDLGNNQTYTIEVRVAK